MLEIPRIKKPRDNTRLKYLLDLLVGAVVAADEGRTIQLRSHVSILQFFLHEWIYNCHKIKFLIASVTYYLWHLIYRRKSV